MTVADLESSGVHIIDSQILALSDFTIGQGSTLLFMGGTIKNNTNPQTPITIYGDDITIEAGPVQIFDGPFAFKAETANQPAAWTMDRAYPQWFGVRDYSKDVNEAKKMLKQGNLSDGKAILDSIPDASAAINSAINNPASAYNLKPSRVIYHGANVDVSAMIRRRKSHTPIRCKLMARGSKATSFAR